MKDTRHATLVINIWLLLHVFQVVSLTPMHLVTYTAWIEIALMNNVHLAMLIQYQEVTTTALHV